MTDIGSTHQGYDHNDEIAEFGKEEAQRRARARRDAGLTEARERKQACAAIEGAKPYVPKTRRADVNGYDGDEYRHVVNTFGEGAKRAEAVQEWPEPDDVEALSDLPAPAFPIECLPPAMRGWAEDSARRIQCPVEMVAVPMIAMTAGAIGAHAAIRMSAGDWFERPALYSMIISPRSFSKTPTFKAATFPLSVIEREWEPGFRAAMAEWNKLEAEHKVRRQA